MKQRNVSFPPSEPVIRDMRCSAVCHQEEPPPTLRAPQHTPQPQPQPQPARPLLAWRHSNQLQMCSGSSEGLLKVLWKVLLTGRPGSRREETFHSKSPQKQQQTRIHA